MSKKNPFNIQMHRTSSSDRPLIFYFSYKLGEEYNQVYAVSDTDKVEKFLNCHKINTDLSAVTNREEANAYMQQFMESYPQLPTEELQKLLESHKQLVAKHDKELHLHGDAHNIVYNNMVDIWRQDSDKNKDALYEYLKRTIGAVARGEDPKNVQRNSSRWQRLTNSGMASVENEILESFYKQGSSTNKSKITVSQENAGEIADNLPKQRFASREECDKWTNWVSCGDNALFNGPTDKALSDVRDQLLGHLMDMAIREKVETVLKLEIDQHLKKLRIAEKAQARQAKIAQRKKSDNEAYKETRQASADRKEFKESQVVDKRQEDINRAKKRVEAKLRLAEKGLTVLPDEKGGKDVHWGDAPKKEAVSKTVIKPKGGREE